MPGSFTKAGVETSKNPRILKNSLILSRINARFFCILRKFFVLISVFFVYYDDDSGRCSEGSSAKSVLKYFIIINFIMAVSSRTIISVLFLAIFIGGLIVFRSLLTPLVLGLIIALIFNPFYQVMKRIFKKHDSLNSFLVTLSVFLLLVGPAVLVFFLVLNEMTVILSKFLSFIDQTGLKADSLFFLNLLSQLGINTETFLVSHVLPFLNNIGSTASRVLVSLFANLPKIIFDFFLMLFSVFFFLKDGKRLREFFFNIIPFSESDKKHLLETFHGVVLGIFWSQFLTALAQGFLGGFGFYLFGLGSPVFFGILMTFFSLIPFIGPMIVYLPATAYLFISGAPLPTVFLLLVYNLFVVSSVDNIVKPLVIGSRIKIHPALIFFGLIGGLRFFGALGLIYGPLIVALFILFADLYLEKTKQESLFHNGHK